MTTPPTKKKRPKFNSRNVLIATGVGLLVAGAGLYSLGCLYLNDTCIVTDDGLVVCAPVCDPDDILCQEENGRLLVDNWEAMPGDWTRCPYGNVDFEVQDDSSRVTYRGYSFVFECSSECIDIIEAKPAKYLDRLVEDAGGSSPNPDPNLGGSVEDEEERE